MEFMKDTYRRSRRWEFLFYGLMIGVILGIILGSGILKELFAQG
jgi:hypothetical protein